MKFCILLSFFLTTFLWSQEERRSHCPKLFFRLCYGTHKAAKTSPMLLGETRTMATPRSFLYGILGMPSKKCSFYGDGELALLRQKEPYEIKDDGNQYQLISKIRYRFPQRNLLIPLFSLLLQRKEKLGRLGTCPLTRRRSRRTLHLQFSTQFPGRHPFWQIQVYACPGQDGDDQSHPQGHGKSSYGAFGLPP